MLSIIHAAPAGIWLTTVETESIHGSGWYSATCYLLAYLLTYLFTGGAGEEMEQKRQLEEQLRAYQDKKRYKKRQIRELDEDLRVNQLCLTVFQLATPPQLAGHASLAGYASLAGHASIAGHASPAGHACLAGHASLAGHCSLSAFTIIQSFFHTNCVLNKM